MKRKKTKPVFVGSVQIGGRAPVVIQSMTKVATTDISRCLRQIKQLADAGCKLVRIAVPTRKDTQAFAKLTERSPVPLIADVHFSPARAIEAIEAGAAKIRLNPGNIKERKDIIRIIEAAKAHHTAIRIGVNEASIRDLKDDTPPAKRVSLMLREMKRYVRLFEKQRLDRIVLSAKSSDATRTIQINRKLSETFDYPLHIGLTHAGLPEDAAISSAATLGTLLAEGIGDTIRVSAAGNPVIEVQIARDILIALGHHFRQTPEIIVCPTCGRTELDVVALAKKVKKAVSRIDKPIRIAVMGCVVNGPGEAADADIAICAAKDKAFFYVNGKKITSVPQTKIIPTLLEHAARF